VNNDDGSLELLVPPEDYDTLRKALAEADLEPADATVTMRPETTVEVADEDGRRTLRLIEMLEDLDDVQNVYTNADIDESAYEPA